MATDRPCPLCCGDRRETRYSAPPLWRHVACLDCGLVYVSPLPDDLSEMNTETYGHTPGGPPGSQGRIPRRHHRELKFLGRKGTGALLDVGCGTGKFLLAAKQRGWKVAGVDLAEANAVAAQEAGLDVRAALLADAAFEPESFSAARVNQVIEHATNPLGLLRDVARVLRPGGVLSLATSNIESLTAKQLGKRWHHLGQEGNAHVVLFSRRTLARALEETGFKPLRWQTIGLRLKVRTPGLAGRFWRTAARALTPLAEAAGRGGRIHVFAERR